MFAVCDWLKRGKNRKTRCSTYTRQFTFYQSMQRAPRKAKYFQRDRCVCELHRAKGSPDSRKKYRSRIFACCPRLETRRNAGNVGNAENQTDSTLAEQETAFKATAKVKLVRWNAHRWCAKLVRLTNMYDNCARVVYYRRGGNEDE